MFNSSCYRGFSSFRILSFSEAEVRYLSEYWISINSGAGSVCRWRQAGWAPLSPQSPPPGVPAEAGPGSGLVWSHEGSLSRCEGVLHLDLLTFIFQEARYRQTAWSSSGLTALPQTSRSGGRRRGGLAVWRSSLISSFREPGRQTSGKYFDQRHQFVTQSMTSNMA